MERYSRQLGIDDIGLDGQNKLTQSKVLIIGLGGLGSPVAMYLASAGVGTIGLLDSDVVSLSDLNRQILYKESDIDKLKVECAHKYLINLNSDTEYNVHNTRLIENNAVDIIAHYDTIISCVDSYATRYIINKACVELNKYLIDGAVEGYSGYVFPIVPRVTPCYNCLFPNMIDNDSDKMVIGAAAGTIGTIMAIECIKYIAYPESDLVGKMLVADTREMDITKVKVDKNDNCVICK